VFLAEPQPTRYDLRFQIAGFPVRVHPLFWLMGIILGAQTGDGIELLIWVGVVFVSILVHELGHAFTMRLFGQSARIVMYMMGGLAIPETSSWQFGSSTRSRGPREQILISAAGPAAGFLLAGAVVGGIYAAGGSVSLRLVYSVIPVWGLTLPPTFNVYWWDLLNSLLWVNTFWGLMNLLPVYPLDGGQISRELFLLGDPHSGMAKSLWLSVIVGGAVAVFGLAVMHSIFLALLFGSLAFSSYQILQHFGGGRW
jgi:Zn-dependent protease